MLAVVAAFVSKDHQIGALEPGGKGQLVADAGQSGGVTPVLAEHHQGPHQQGDQAGKEADGPGLDRPRTSLQQGFDRLLEDWPGRPGWQGEAGPPELAQPAVFMPPRALGRELYGRSAINHILKQLLPTSQDRLGAVAVCRMGLALAP